MNAKCMLVVGHNFLRPFTRKPYNYEGEALGDTSYTGTLPIYCRTFGVSDVGCHEAAPSITSIQPLTGHCRVEVSSGTGVGVSQGPTVSGLGLPCGSLLRRGGEL